MKKLLIILIIAFTVIACNEQSNQPVPTPAPRVDSMVMTTAELCAKLGITDQKVIAMLPNRKVRVDTYNYQTFDAVGNYVKASGIVTTPLDVDVKILKVLLAEHYTYGADSEVPSKTKASIESLMALFDYMVVAPDYLGFGSSVTMPSPYHHALLTGRSSADLVAVAVADYTNRYSKLPISITAIGYSQGAHAVLATAKDIQKKSTNKLKVTNIYAGAGAYDLLTTYDVLIGQSVSALPAVIPMLVVGLDYGDRLGLNFSKLFKEPLLSNYAEWINSKKYTTTEISTKIGSNKLADFLAPEIFNRSDSNTMKFLASLKLNSVIEGWTPDAQIKLYHSNGDDIVPYVNSTLAFDAFRAKGCAVQLTTIEGKVHLDAAVEFYTSSMREIILAQQGEMVGGKAEQLAAAISQAIAVK